MDPVRGQTVIIGATKAKTLVIGGGVSANTHIRRVFAAMMEKEFPAVALHIPEQKLTTDNAIMIGLAGYFKKKGKKNIVASGNLQL